MSLWAELRRRNVVKVAVAYAIVGWLLVQVAGSFFPALRLPEWTVTLVAALVILGFPVALLLSWAYELTPEGVKRTESVPVGESITHVTGQKLNFAITVLVVLVLGFVVIDQYVLDDDGDATGPRGSSALNETSAAQTLAGVLSRTLPNSVAVLPFENLSPNPDDAYFARGIHEEILNQLAKLKNLSVISRTSVEKYTDTALSIPEIATELNVGTVMEGSVRFGGTRIRVTTQLIDAATDEHLWSETYEREFDDVFAIESDIAMNVANALQAEFSPEEQRSIEAVPTSSPEAYSLYLRAYATAGAESDALIDEALRLDPNFAPAHALKAINSAASMINTTGSAAETDWLELVDLATASAERALAIDPNVGNAYSALSVVHEFLWHWDEADQANERALELAPNDTNVIWPAAWFTAFSGDYEEAIRLAEREIELAPLVSRSYMDLAIANEHPGNVDAAIAAYRRSVALDPSNLLARQHLGLVEARAGNFEAAAREFEFIERVFGGEVQFVFLPELAIGYLLIGRDQDAARLADRVFSASEEREVGAGSLAMAYLAIGDADNALAELEKAAERAREFVPDQGFFSLMLIKHNVIGHPTLEEPRFRSVRAQLGGA